MWHDKRAHNPLCYNDSQFLDRNSHDSSISPDFPPVDSACLPPTVKIKRVEDDFCKEHSCLDGDSSTYPTQATQPSSESMSSHRSNVSFVYKTRAPRRGTCLILSVDSFKPALCLPGRPGGDVDVQKLESTFGMLDFDVKAYQNPTVSEISKIIESESLSNHSDADCFACVILTHGDEGGLVYGSDGAIHIDQLITPFRGNSCPSLAGKPKMFFIQACRGTLLDAGTLVATDSGTYGGGSVESGNLGSLRRIPIESDLLVAYAVQPGYYAFRNSVYGSWFVQALTSCLAKYGRTLDLMSILTRVNYEVAFEFESLASNIEYSGKKQVPSIVSTLTKDVFFPPKTKRCFSPSQQ